MSVLMLAAAAAFSPSLEAAIQNYTGCTVSAVQAGTSARLDPAIFAQGFAKSCLAEEHAFFEEAVRQEMRNGKTEAEAALRIAQDIADNRQVVLRNQSWYLATGKTAQ